MPGRLQFLTLLLILILAKPLHAGLFRGLEGPTPAEATAIAQARYDHTSYSLPEDKLAKAQALHRIEEMVAVSSSVWTPLQLLLVLSCGLAAWMRDTAERAARGWALRIAVFMLLLLLVHTVLHLPIRIYAHHVSLTYGLSVEGWPAWFGDAIKEFGIALLIGTLGAFSFFAILRRTPRRWWLVAWPIAIFFILLGLLLTPYVIDPLFNRFEPLAQSDPALVAQLERVVQRGSMSIPADRMFLMKASEKYTGMNAYVTGFGPSKRIVVWDTTVAHSSPDEIAFVFAHELGHYALGHVITGTALSCMGLLPLFWLAHLGTNAAVRQWGRAWKLRMTPSSAGHAADGIDWSRDMAALVVVLLVVSILSGITEPVANAVSRRVEHNADVYGQEAVHGIVADPQHVGVESFRELGLSSLDDPTPHPVFDAWFGTHPATWLRTAFTRIYNPWIPGSAPKYFLP